MSGLLEVKNLTKYYPIEKGVFKQSVGLVRAVDGVDFSIAEKETLGLVGESGCGKTTCGRLVANLLKPSTGQVLFEEENIYAFKGKSLNNFRKKVQIIFQDPFSSLDPRQSIYDIITEPIKIHHLYRQKDINAKVEELLNLVGLSNDIVKGYPHQLSGGQRQRIGLARILTLNPRLIIADEPVSSLDISIQAQIINLFKDLQQKYNLSYLFISHDLGVVKHIAHRIAVMYLGKIVELAGSDELFAKPYHPYTKMLLQSIPSIKTRENTASAGKEADKITIPFQGCAFYARCNKAASRCREMEPILEAKGENHFVCCWYPE
ncbi:MAG: ATP-binding cassette domain-containing protein [bacterium]|nr:ATP-binding cassette domain-containing protein [bacterium]MDD5756197.1 ATP-binding cassette domain-containing protein [bacterium]